VVVEGGAGAVLANNLDIGNASVGILAGRQVRAGQIKTVVLLGGQVEGEVHTSFDTRQTILAGLIAGVVAGAIALMFRRD
jgi:hypothetical protein